MKLLYKIAGLLLLIISNLIELTAVKVLLDRPETGIISALMLHLLAAITIFAALTFFRVRLSKNSDEDARYYPNPMQTPAFFMAFFMPIFGTLTVSLVALLIKPTSSKDTPVFAEYIDYIKTVEDDIERFDTTDEEHLILRYLKIEPVVDLLGSKSKASVWGSIDNLSKRADSSAVDLIRASIRQNDAEIKFLASIGLDKLEKTLIENIEKCEHEMLINDDLKSHKAYAKAVIDYLNSGIAPSELNTVLIGKALKTVKNARTRFEACEMDFFHACILAGAGRHSESLPLLDELIKVNRLEAEMLPFAMEIYFREGDLRQVRQLMKELVLAANADEIIDNQLLELETNELGEFWLVTEAEPNP